jgi:hypothetical protein
LLEELPDQSPDGLRLLHVRQVPGALDALDAGAADAAGELVSVSG